MEFPALKIHLQKLFKLLLTTTREETNNIWNGEEEEEEWCQYFSTER